MKRTMIRTRLIMILALTAGLVSSKKDVFMPEGQVFPEDFSGNIQIIVIRQ